MKCPYCGATESKVIDSRPTDDFTRIRRRRECLTCEKRFTSYEIVETVALMVVKKDKKREAFAREKIMSGLLKASYKRPVSMEALEGIVDSIEQALLSTYEREVSSITIGELAMRELQRVDEVAYVRFASVYRQFGDINTFMDELKELLERQATGD
jgi:transcriptional repressor NrdR